MLKCTEIKEFINQSASSLFTCGITNNVLTITTPFTYPDGDEIDLYIESKSDYLVLSDLGETLRYLDTYLLDINSTNKRKQILNDVIKSNNVLFNKGIIYAIIKNPANLLDAIFNMSQAIIRLSDVLYTVRSTHTLAVFEEEFKSFLDDNRFNYEENVSVETDSYQYTFDFAVENSKDGIGLVKLMNAPKKPSQKPNINQIVRTWFDINLSLGNKYPKSNRITVLDDTIYKWSPADYTLIENLSQVNHWSQKERILTSLNNIA